LTAGEGAQGQGPPREVVSSDLDRWIRAERLGSGARGVNGTAASAAPSAAVNSPETRQTQTSGSGSPELARTGEGDPANSMAGFRP
jgi:hypothetical protein